MPESQGPSWFDKMAQEMAALSSNTEPTAEFFRACLEAAGEIKAVRLKVLLAQTREIIVASTSFGDAAKYDDGFIDKIDAELK